LSFLKGCQTIHFPGEWISSGFHFYRR